MSGPKKGLNKGNNGDSAVSIKIVKVAIIAPKNRIQVCQQEHFLSSKTAPIVTMIEETILKISIAMNNPKVEAPYIY